VGGGGWVGGGLLHTTEKGQTQRVEKTKGGRKKKERGFLEQQNTFKSHGRSTKQRILSGAKNERGRQKKRGGGGGVTVEYKVGRFLNFVQETRGALSITPAKEEKGRRQTTFVTASNRRTETRGG